MTGGSRIELLKIRISPPSRALMLTLAAALESTEPASFAETERRTR